MSSCCTVRVSSNLPVTVVRLLQQGPPGPPGQSSSTLQIVLAQTVSGGQVVALNNSGQGLPGSVDTMLEASAVAGIATQGGIAGATISVVAYGPASDTGWSWGLGIPVFVGDGGSLTQTPPTTGVLLPIGFPISSTEIFVRPDSPTQL